MLNTKFQVSEPSDSEAEDFFIMPPTSKKLRGHIGLGLSVCPSVRYALCWL